MRSVSLTLCIMHEVSSVAVSPWRASRVSVHFLKLHAQAVARDRNILGPLRRGWLRMPWSSRSDVNLEACKFGNIRVRTILRDAGWRASGVSRRCCNGGLDPSWLSWSDVRIEAGLFCRNRSRRSRCC